MNGHQNLLWAYQCAINGMEMEKHEAIDFLLDVWNPRCNPPWDMSKPRVMYHARIAGDPASESGLAA